ncbi:hypothetical protein BX616_004640, partial [Lobosporangium transversale]
MSDEPRRKRKWDSQGEPDTAVKKTVSEADIALKDTAQTPATGLTTAAQDAPTEQSSIDAAAAAAIEAARISAKLVAQGKASSTNADSNQTASKIDEVQTAFSASETPASNSGNVNNGGPAKEFKKRDEFVTDIDINDVKHRSLLTKGSVQTQLQRDTGADVTTRGIYYADRSMATEKDPPLYLHVTAVSQEILDAAVRKINELIEEAQNPPPLPSQRESFQPGPRFHGGPPRHQTFHARVAIGIESDRMFNVRAKIVGPGGEYVKHVQNKTRTRVQLKGYGSGYLEAETGRESDEPLYINI